MESGSEELVEGDEALGGFRLAGRAVRQSHAKGSAVLYCT